MMRRLRPLLLIALPIIVVLVGSNLWFGRDPSYESKCGNYVEDWPRDLGARRPMIVVTGTSVSGMRAHGQTLARSLQRRLKSIDARVYNGVGSATFMADQWAMVQKTAHHNVALYLFEINALLFNEREDLLTPATQILTVREESNVTPLFGLDEWRLRWHLWRQAGFEPLLRAGLSALFRPYEAGQCLQASRRTKLRKLALGRANRIKRLAPMHLRSEITGRNFRNKDYESGLDLWVLERFSQWALEEDVPVVFYFPPLNVPYIEEAAGEQAWTRFDLWRERFLASCRDRGLICRDYTRLFAHQAEIFMDYGHYPDGEKRKRGFDKFADNIADTVQQELSRRRKP